MATEKTTAILEIEVDAGEAIKTIERYKSQIQVLKKEQQNLREELKKGKISQEEYTKANTEAEVAIKTTQEAMRLTGRELKNLITLHGEEKDSLLSLRAELSKVTLAYDRLSESDRNAAKGKEMLEYIKKLQDQIRPLEESTGRFQRSVGNYQQSIVNAVASMNPLAARLVSIVDLSDETAGGFTKIKTSAQAFGKTLLSLVKNPAFLAIFGIAAAGSAFKFWYDYNKGLIEATRLTKQFTDLSGEELVYYRSEVQAVSDTFNKDFVEVLRGANALQKQFGITSQEALELVKEGFANGADVNEQFLKNIKEYSTFFKEAGLSAEEFIAINVQTEKQGIFSDKGIDAIKEANIRLREMTTATSTALEGIGISSKRVQEELQNGSKTTFDIMQEVSAKLNELPDSASTVGAALADIFGGPGEDAGLAYIRTLSQIDTDLDTISGKTGEVAELNRMLVDSQTNLNTQVALLFEAGSGFDRFITKIKSGWNNFLADFLSGVRMIFESTDDKNMRKITEAINKGRNEAVEDLELLNQEVSRLTAAGIESGLTASEAQLRAIDMRKKEIQADLSKYEKEVSERNANIERMEKEIENSGTGRKEALKRANLAEEIEKENERLRLAMQLRSKYETMLGQVNDMEYKAGTGTSTSTNKSTAQIDAEAEEIEKAEAAMLKVLEETSAEYKAILDKRYKRDKKAIEDKIALYEEDKKLTPKMQKALNDQLEALKKEHARDIAAISKKATDDQIAEQERLINLKLEAAEKGSEKEHTLRLQQLEQQKQQEIAAAKGNEEEIALIKEKYRIKESEEDKRFKDNQAKQQADVYKKELNERNLEWQNKIDAAKMNGENYLQLMVEQSQQDLERIREAGQKECETKEEYNARLLAAQQKYNDSVKAKNDAEVQMQLAKTQAIGQIIGSFSDLFGAFGEENIEMLKLSKALAIAEVAINQGIAISEAVKNATSDPKNALAPWLIPVKIAAAVAAVTTTIVTAVKSINDAEKQIAEAEAQKSSGKTGTVTVKGYSTGGLVKGEGTGTSDSIPARLSAGEFVIPAKTYKMFSPVINSIYRTGQNWNAANRVYSPASSNYGNTISEDMLSRVVSNAVISGIKNLDIHSAVSVVDINKGQRNVDVKELRAENMIKK
jgi:hypothetical protein